jgi:hypothetical protein
MSTMLWRTGTPKGEIKISIFIAIDLMQIAPVTRPAHQPGDFSGKIIAQDYLKYKLLL